MSADDFRIEVKREHIHDTPFRSYKDNPLSLAVGEPDVWAFLGYLCGPDARHWAYSRRAARFLRRYMSGQEVEPATFVLRPLER
jgi:hypothetical protein